MKSVLDELPEGPAASEEFAVALDRFISERGLYLPLPAQEQLDAGVATLLARIAAWSSDKRPVDETPPTERLVRSWLRRRLPSLREASEYFRRFVARERSNRLAWNLSHFIGNWFVTEGHPAAAEVVLLFEVVISKTMEEQERLISPAIRTVVRRIRALEKAAVALKNEIELRSVPDGRSFWPGVVDGLTAAIRQTIGDEAARATAASMEGVFPPLAAPFLALVRLWPQWEPLLTISHQLGEATLAAMQENFSSATLGSAHAPEKRGLRFRIGLLDRAGFSQTEIADFEAVTAEAVAEHLRRLRRSPGGQ